MAYPARQLQTYAPRGVVVDANLLLLLILGSYDRRQISTNKRLLKFSQEDFDLLVRVLKRFAKVVTTPNILTEVSNLSQAIAESEKAAYFARFASMLTLVREEHVPSATALANRWARFGLTDAAIAEIGEQRLPGPHRRSAIVVCPADRRHRHVELQSASESVASTAGR